MREMTQFPFHYERSKVRAAGNYRVFRPPDKVTSETGPRREMAHELMRCAASGYALNGLDYLNTVLLGLGAAHQSCSCCIEAILLALCHSNFLKRKKERHENEMPITESFEFRFELPRAVVRQFLLWAAESNTREGRELEGISLREICPMVEWYTAAAIQGETEFSSVSRRPGRALFAESSLANEYLRRTVYVH